MRPCGRRRGFIVANRTLPLAPTAPVLDESTLNRTIIQLAVPAILENLLGTAVFFADTLLLGWLKDPAALAAIGLSGTYNFIAQGIFMSLGIGALAVVARAWGAGDFAEAKRAAGQAIAMTVVLSLLIMPVMMLLAQPFLSLLMQDPDAAMRETVVRMGAEYSFILLLSAPLAFPRIVISMIMRAAGDTRTPMLITLLVNAINIVLALTLIFGFGPIPELGIHGAGIATAVAQGLGGLAAFAALITGHAKPHMRAREMTVWDPVEIKRIWRLALPNIAESGIQRVGFITFMGIVSGLGTASMAAHQITNSVESMSFMPAWGLATAVSTIVGQALGARNVRVAELATFRSALIGTAVMIAAGAAFVVFGAQLASVFGAENDVLLLASSAVKLSALELPTLTIYMIYSAALRGAGDTRSPMIVSLIGALFFRVAAVWLLAVKFGLGLDGVWLGTAVDWLGRAVVVYVLYRRGRWKTLNV